MITSTSNRQLTLDGFHLPFGGKLDPENRWVKLSEVIPWDDFARIYLVVGAMLIKHKLNLSDEETVQQIQENPYLQFFVGRSSFTGEQPFAPSLFVEIRKRMGVDLFRDFVNVLLAQLGKPPVTPEKDHFGRILMEATICEQRIRYPTDLSLLNQAREISEKLIDGLHHLFCQDPANKGTRKPRTYRHRARKEYLKQAKNKKMIASIRRSAIRGQLQYLRRNFSHIEKLLDAVGCPPFPLEYKLQRHYWIIQLKGCIRPKRDTVRIGLSLCLNLMFVQGRKSTEFGAKNRVSRLPAGSLLSTGLAGMRLMRVRILRARWKGTGTALAVCRRLYSQTSFMVLVTTDTF